MKFAEANRMRAGTSSVGQSGLARGWEDLTDAAINPSTVADQADIHRLFNYGKEGAASHPEPWMAKVSPYTKVYGINDNRGNSSTSIWSASDFGYDHILDVLREDLTTGRILPENLNKMSMEHAVRRTYQYDQELAKRMSEASILAREGLPVRKEYPDTGYRWLELNKPGSFAAESDAMGHSARGYEPPKGHPDWVEGSGRAGNPNYGLGGWEAIKSGKAKMYSLVDKEGKSHATIEVAEPTDYSRAIEATKLRNQGLSPEEASLAVQNMHPSINQIKPPGNQWNSEASMGRIAENPKYMEDIQPYLQDFVKTGKWSSVNDLHNTGLIHRDGKYLTSAEDAEYLANELKPDGMAKGGLVHMAPGGVVKWASQLAKTINSHKMESMSGEQWMKWLNANAPKSAKKEALASGTLDWLPQQGKVSKGAIIEHMKANAPQIKVKKFENNPKPGMQARFEELRNEGEVRRLTSSERDEIEELEQKLEDTPKTKFDEHVLPGGKNYREMTLSTSNPTGDDYIVPAAHTYRDNDADLNRILHMRMNDRPYAGGNALNIEELQSDWAQQGRSRGFTKDGEIDALRAEKSRIEGLLDALPEETSDAERMRRFGGLIDINDRLIRIEGKGLPSGPYVQNTEDWTRLGLHNAIKEAAEQGHNAVTWTGGEAQANRWSDEGEGMYKYYDEIVPSVSNDILKKMGVAERVGEFDVGTGVPHQGFNITPEMLDYIKQNGMPRFQDGGQAHYNKAEQVVESTQDLIDKFVEMYEKTSGKEPKPPKEVFRDPWDMKDGGAAPRRDVSELMPLDNPHEGMSHGTARPATMEEMRALQPWKYEEEGLEDPLLSPDMLIGTGLPTALAKRLGKGAVGAGKFVAPKANQLLEEYMVKSGMQLPATVWHGSPHTFGKFDASKIGTGEGAQAYGHGHYVADARKVGQQYKDDVSDAFHAREIFPRESLKSTLVSRLSQDQNVIRGNKHLSPQERQDIHRQIKSIDDEIHTIKQAFDPSLYKIDLPDEHIAKMLDWDKPLSEQPHIQKALHGTKYRVGINEKEAERIAEDNLNNDASQWASDTHDQHGYEPDITEFTNNANWDKYVSDARKSAGGLDSSMTGKDLHNMVKYDEGYRAGLFDPENYQVGTSEHLNSLGIPGIKYLDGSSRRAGEGSSNYVVFPGNEDMLNILERNPSKAKGGAIRRNVNELHPLY